MYNKGQNGQNMFNNIKQRVNLMKVHFNEILLNRMSFVCKLVVIIVFGLF